jgi:hypothetical protein
LEVLHQTLSPHVLTKNLPHGPVWKVTVMPCRDDSDNYFAVLFSLSHVVGDGAVFYRLHRMLCSIDEEVEALKMETIKEWDRIVQDALGADAVAFTKSPAITVKALMGFIHAKLIRPLLNGQANEELWFLVDNDAMKVEKKRQAAEAGVPFVSTNDVLTSWFLRESGSSAAFLCVDFRNRLPGATEAHGRNYWGVIVYQREDFASAALVRESLGSLRRTESGTLPTAWDFISKGSLGAATSWASFPSRMELPGCMKEVHCPLFDFASFCPTSFVVMRTFSPLEGKIGVYIAGDPSMVEPLKHAAFRSNEPLI